MKKTIKPAGGFTLAEILIMLVILGFVGALGVPMLGANKVKKPMEVKAYHGTIECFWENDKLMQFTSNNTNNKSGELKDVTGEGACYFTAPIANLFVLHAIGAGGGGAVGIQGKPWYKNATKRVEGYIPTDTSFLSVISDKEKVPEWVRNEWDKQWSNDDSNWIEYILESPLGSSGDGDCAPIRIDTEENKYNDCSMKCVVNIEECPEYCIYRYAANGGNSGNGAKYKVKSKINYSPKGMMDSVEFIKTKDESTLRIGDKFITLRPSGEGKNGVVNVINYSNVEVKHGSKGEDFKVSAVSNNYMSFSGMKLTEWQHLTKAPKGGEGCKTPNKLPLMGKVSLGKDKRIKYETDSLAIEVNFGLAGDAGESVQKILEKLPADTQFKLVPVKSNSEGEPCKDNAARTCSYIYMKDNTTGEWKPFVSAGSGIDGWGGIDILPVEEGDLPFPKAYAKAFQSRYPSPSLIAGASYKSYIKSHYGIQPGVSGEGSYPIVTHVEGSAVHWINGKRTGNEPLKPLANSDRQCFEGVSGWGGAVQPDPNKPPIHVNEYCGDYDETKGEPGAVVISW